MPILPTDRLRLRGFAERDREAYAAMLGHWLLRGFGLWAVEERATGALVGRVGLPESTGGPGFAYEGGWVRRQLRLLQWDGRAGDISTGTTRLVREVAGVR